MFEKECKLRPYYLHNLLIQGRKLRLKVFTNDVNIKKSLEGYGVPIVLIKLPDGAKAVHQTGIEISVDDFIQTFPRTMES